MHAGAVTELLKSRLGVAASCLNFIRGDSVRIQFATGTESNVSYKAPGLCFWTLVPDQSQVLVIEDLLKDARYTICSVGIASDWSDYLSRALFAESFQTDKDTV